MGIIHPAHHSSQSCIDRGMFTDFIPCIDGSLRKIESVIRATRENGFSNVESLANALSELNKFIDPPTESDPDQSPTTTTAACIATTTASSAGCEVTAATSTITTHCTATQTATECEVSCPSTLGSVSSSLNIPTPHTTCTTTCSTLTGCGDINASTATTATLSRTSGSLEQCSARCAVCVATALPALSTSASTSTGKKLPEVLSERTLPAPWDLEYAGNVGDFLVDQYVRAEWVPLAADGDGSAVSSALFHELKNEPYNMVVRGLYGCTSVVVVSERAVWMSHHWEVPFFSPGSWEIGSQDQFRKGVLDELVDGGPQISGLKQYTGQDGPFALHYRPAAYVVRPEGAGRPDYDKAYDAKVYQIVDTVKDILGVGIPPLPITYTRSGGDNAVSPKGKILFQYDPAQDDSPANGGCPIQKAMERVWVEDKPIWIHQRYWAAYDDQMVFNSHWKRDACPVSSSATSKSSLPSFALGHHTSESAKTFYTATPPSSLPTEGTVRPTSTRSAVTTITKPRPNYVSSPTVFTTHNLFSAFPKQSRTLSTQASEVLPEISGAAPGMSAQSRPTPLTGSPTSMSLSETTPPCYIK